MWTKNNNEKLFAFFLCSFYGDGRRVNDLFLLLISFLTLLPYTYIASTQVEVERIDVGEPENPGTYDMVRRFLQ
jgi:hypothetical protein